jgi:hypothetical protein
MNKNEVEQILIIVKSGQDEALNMKIYKNGTICRRGCGGLPQINTSGMSFTESSVIFDKLMESVPEVVLETPINHQDPEINSPLEYIVAFYGISKNGETGERAEWTKSTGIRFLIDNNTTFRHPLLSFCDGIAIEATKLTNEWYFDVILMSTQKVKSNKLPEQTIIASPKSDNELNADFTNYISQTDKSDLQLFANNKIYVDKSEIEHKLTFTISENSVNYNFQPIGLSGFKFAETTTNKSSNTAVVKPEKKWWKIWQ